MKMMMTIPMIMMMMTSLMTSNQKNNGKLCMILILYSIETSVMLAMKINLTIIPFIVILTMSGGLMVLFLYFTASLPNPKPSLPATKLEKKTMIFPMLTIPLSSIIMMTLNSTSPVIMPKTNTDTAMMLFTESLLPLTSMMVSLLLTMLAMTIITCSKQKSPMRQSINPWN